MGIHLLNPSDCHLANNYKTLFSFSLFLL